MQHLLAALCAVTLGAALSAQAATNTLEFRHGGSLEVSHAQLDLAEGTTLERLMSEGEEASRFRQFFNENGFLSRIGGSLALSHTTEIAGNELDPGSYKLSFRIDDDLVWYLVVLSEDSEEIFASVLDVKKSSGNRSKRLVIQPMATDNAEAKGRIAIRFGELTASVSMSVLDAETGTPGTNTNQDAPTATHELDFGDDTVIGVSYRQLTLGGGQNLKTLLSKGERGDGMRQFYNTQYLPGILHGSLTFSTPTSLGGHSLPPGEHEFTFRIDNDLVWHLVLGEDASIPLDVESDADLSDRLLVQPIAATGDEPGGHLTIRYGPLAASVAFGSDTAGPDSRPSDGVK